MKSFEGEPALVTGAGGGIGLAMAKAFAEAGASRCLTATQRKAFFLPPEPPAWCIEMEKWPYDTSEWKQWLADKRAGKNPTPPAAP